MLSSKQIEIFYEVYKHSSMTAAANKMEISQPSISKTLGNIEKTLVLSFFSMSISICAWKLEIPINRIRMEVKYTIRMAVLFC